MEISYISEQKYKFWQLSWKSIGQAPMLLIIDVPDS